MTATGTATVYETAAAVPRRRRPSRWRERGTVLLYLSPWIIGFVLNFFLAVGFLKPHLPFCAPRKYWDLYDRSSFTVPVLRTAPEGAPKYAPSGWGELRQYSDIPDSGPLTDEQARTMIHGYHAAVSYMDAQLGKVIDELDHLV